MGARVYTRAHRARARAHTRPQTATAAHPRRVGQTHSDTATSLQMALGQRVDLCVNVPKSAKKFGGFKKNAYLRPRNQTNQLSYETEILQRQRTALCRENP